jgi:hypothetical protein
MFILCIILFPIACYFNRLSELPSYFGTTDYTEVGYKFWLVVLCVTLKEDVVSI